MRCPQCQFEQFRLDLACPNCQFEANVELLQKLSNVQFLISESFDWSQFDSKKLEALQADYGRKLRQVEVELGVRQPPPTLTEARQLGQQKVIYEQYLKELAVWETNKWISADDRSDIREETAVSLRAIEDRLIDAPAVFNTRIERQEGLLDKSRFVLVQVQLLGKEGKLSKNGTQTLTNHYNTQIEKLETKLGLRVTVPAEPKPSRLAQIRKRIPRINRQTQDDDKLREPWTWDRVWETLLSERTLEVILFIGVALLFAAGLTWVGFNWGTFAPPVQIAFLVGFTGLFFGLGTYVFRTLKLRGSGIAMFGVGSLLIPLDFYAFYLSGGFPDGSEPLIWMIGSVVCLIVYLLVAYGLRAPFFGYLIGFALASNGLAGLNLANVPLVWWQTAVSITGFILGLIGFIGLQNKEHRSAFLAEPFQRIGLLFVSVVMILGFSWRFFFGIPFLNIVLPLAINWWLGGVILALGARHIRLTGLVWGAAVSFPIAMWFTQQSILPSTVSTGWYGVGWAILVPFYFVFGKRLHSKNSGESANYDQIVLIVAGGITAVSAIWSLTNTTAASIVHPLLAVTLIFATVLWQQPRWLWLSSVLFMSGAAAWLGARGATVQELTLPWGLLSIFFVAIAIQLRHQKIRYDAPLFGMGWLAALATILPSAILYDRTLLVYALANWIGINGWLAILATPKHHLGLQKFLKESLAKRLGETLFHWSASLALLPWLVLFLTSETSEPSPVLTVAYAGLAWLMLGIGVWVRRFGWKNGRSWFVSANLAIVIVLYLQLTGFGFWQANSEIWYGSALLSVAAFYLIFALLSNRKGWFYVAGWLGAFGWSILIEALTRTVDNQFMIWDRPQFLGLLPIILLAISLFAWLVSRRWRTHSFYRPLYITILIQSGLFILISLGFLDTVERAEYMWVALAYGLIALSFACFAWIYRHQITAHLGIWMMIGAGGLLVLQFSRGSGRSAFLAGLLAIILILAERGLRPLTLRAISPPTRLFRQLWRLYRRPLQLAGWMISLGTIGLATFRNLIWLGGGETRQTWSVLALTAVVVLYVLSGWLYKKKRFAYFAAGLAVLPWTLLTDLGFYIWPTQPDVITFGWSWTIFALILIGVVALLLNYLSDKGWAGAVQLVAIGITSFGLPLSLSNEGTVGAWAFLTGIVFFATAVYLDRRFYKPDGWQYGRFLYPLLLLIPIWSTLVFDLIVPNETFTQIGLLILLFSGPALWLGRWIATREPSYQLPFYLLAYGTAISALPFVAETQPVLIGALFYLVGLTTVSVWIFDEPLWWFPSTFTLPFAVGLLMDQLNLVETHYLGWMLIGLGGLYLVGAWLLTVQEMKRYSWPLLTMSALFGVFGLPFLLDSTVGTAVGFLGAAILFAAMAIWRKVPIVFLWVSFLTVVSYGASLWEIEPSDNELALAVWPLVLFFLGTAVYFDRVLGRLKPIDMQSIGWGNPDSFIYRWQSRLLLWWGFSFYVSAFALVPIASILGIESEWRWVIGMGLGTAVYAFALFRHKQKLFLWLAGVWLQFTWSVFLYWREWGEASGTEFTFFFLPATVLTAVTAILIERGVFRQWFSWLAGRQWAIPLYVLLLINFMLGQMLAFEGSWQGVWITFIHGLLAAVMVTMWSYELMFTLPLLLWFIAFAQVGDWLNWTSETTIPRMAALALFYGAVGYAWRWRSRIVDLSRHWFGLWQRPLIWGGWILSSLMLFIALSRGINVVSLGLRALFGNVILLAEEVTRTQMVVATLAVVGLFYLMAALSERRPRWSYGALLLLILSWSLWLRLIGQQAELQFYAIPVSIYLLGIGWYEWETGIQPLARWIDRLALLLLFGSAFWQSLMAEVGGVYALLMIIEGLLIVWLGSGRRLRRLLYSGVTAVMVALMGQLIRPLLALNTGVLLLLGVILVGLGILLERRLENVRTLSKEFRQRLESWE